MFWAWPYLILFFLFFSFSFSLHHLACGILIPRPRVKLTPPALKVKSLNHWTVREVQDAELLKVTRTCSPGRAKELKLKIWQNKNHSLVLYNCFLIPLAVPLAVLLMRAIPIFLYSPFHKYLSGCGYHSIWFQTSDTLLSLVCFYLHT